MSRNVRKYLVSSMALSMALGLTACGGSDAAEGGSVELEFWNPETDPAVVSVLEDTIADYEAENPGVTVNLVNVPWADIYTKWQTALSAGNAPDVTIGSAGFATSFQAQGVLEPLDDVVADIGGESAWADTASTLVEMSKTSDGDYFTLPFVNNSVVLWYSKEMLADAGLQPPTTWDELEAAAAAMTHGDQYGILVPSSTSMVTTQSLYSMILSAGGDLVDRDDPTTVTFDSPEAVEALDFYSSLARYSPPGSGGYDRPEAQAAMTTGKLGMFVYGSWMQGALEAAGPDVAAQFGAVPVPTNGGAGAFMGNSTLMAFNQSEHPDEAKDFLAYLLDPAHYEELVLANPSSYLPVLAEVKTSETYLNDEHVAGMEELLDAVRQTLPNAWVFGLPNPHAGEWEGLNLVAQAATAVIEGGEDPQAAATKVADQMRDSIDE
ncbi:ABC transporter substrate-binding protein [uncultured Cellulomonas sp.]|uniref:ABC transporter substrate-binding protein n=1 Tax=uncultured Cellulomonas sp. TaxID=189682 RepID=UPI00262994A2|nr:sugar ABC transporter substrate-binding protein [uncultured Cellulomonas sp.]